MIERNCIICGNVFKVRYVYNIQKTCSYACGNKMKSIRTKGMPKSKKQMAAVKSYKHTGMLGMKHSEKTKIKISIALKGKRIGYKLSTEHIEKIKSAHKKPNYKNSEQFSKGKDNKRWKGGNYIRPNGNQHRKVMEEFLKRKLVKGETIHHIDGNPFNNSINNLMLFASNSEHIKFHHEQEKLKSSS